MSQHSVIRCDVCDIQIMQNGPKSSAHLYHMKEQEVRLQTKPDGPYRNMKIVISVKLADDQDICQKCADRLLGVFNEQRVSKRGITE